MQPFPYQTATAAQIESRARALVGRELVDIDRRAPMVPSSARTKGVVGRIYESAFDIPANSIAGPDFPGAAIELKSVPIMLVRGEAKAKERISVGMIDFAALPLQTWETAEARKKLGQMLLIFYGWEPLQPIARFKTLAAGIWSPDGGTLKAIERDWQSIRDLVAAGRRDEVSESLTAVLGAATKGAGHGSVSRAWSLKQPFVGWIYRSMTGAITMANVGPSSDPAAQFEAGVLARLAPYVGRDFDALASVAGRSGKGGKSAVAATVRALVGELSRGRHGDFERYGVEVKTVPVDRRGMAVEAMSFPAFVHEELIFETWEDSDLLGRLNRLLIVPVHRSSRATPRQTLLGRPFFWRPPESDLEGIRREWERYRSLIEAGRSRDLPKASETTFIHVRPKSRNAMDTDVAPGGFDVVKKCFWLNQSYLERILAEHDALTPPRPR